MGKVWTREDALGLFDRIDWQSEAAAAEVQQKVAPTLSIRADDGDDLVWVSVGKEADGSLFFVTDCSVQVGERRILFGLIKSPRYAGGSNSGTSKEGARKVLGEFFDLREQKTSE